MQAIYYISSRKGVMITKKMNRNKAKQLTFLEGRK